MTNNKTKWLAYTVLVGLIPILSRIFVWLTAKPDTMHLLAATDFVAFGLVLHISNFNELEHVSTERHKEWKTIQNGVSLIFVALYSVLYAILLIGEKNPSLIDMKSMLTCVMALASVSFVLSLSIFHRLSKLTI
jgi:uncharacterized membrane protein YkgB